VDEARMMAWNYIFGACPENVYSATTRIGRISIWSRFFSVKSLWDYPHEVRSRPFTVSLGLVYSQVFSVLQLNSTYNFWK